MFTGIVEEIGEIKELRRGGAGVKVFICAKKVLEGVKIGDSLNADGVCLTVTEVGESGFWVDIVGETMRKTTFSKVNRARRVNLERALKLSDRLGGHLVSGHADCVGTIVGKSQGKAVVQMPSEIRRYIFPGASVAVDGISLTVQKSYGNRFEIAIIPHTEANTTMGLKKVGECVNLEADLIGKHVEVLLSQSGLRK